MKILALDSSGLTASVAVVEDDVLLAEYTVNYKKTHSQTLLPMIDEIIRITETDKTSFDAIAVSAGPGSCTGLRIGSATAKGLGLAWKIPLAAVPTLDAMAYQCYLAQGLICPIMDARRKQVYTGLYRFTDFDSDGIDLKSEKSKMEIVAPQMAIGVMELMEKLNDLGQPVTFLGDGVPVYREMLAEGMRVPYRFAPAHMNRQRAASVGALGIEYYKKGKIETAAQHQPDYLRVSQAEREREERMKKES